jgi:hypothetical protein
MKIILQNSKTAKFMRCDSMWTVDTDEALNFLSVQRAIFFGMKELIDSFQVLQIESNGLSTHVIVMIPQPQWPKYQVLPAESNEVPEQKLPQNLRLLPSASGLPITRPMTASRFQ